MAMAEETRGEELVELRTRVATLEATLSAQRSQRSARKRTAWRVVPAIALALLLALVPLAVFGAGFTDLNANSPHNDNINAIADAGITKGCNPPANDQYCPNDLVTREQMASFLARTAGLGNNKPVANAATLAMANPAAGGTTYAANDLVRGSYNAQQNVTVGSLYTPIAAVTITTTRPGMVFLFLSARAATTSTSGCPCDIFLITHDATLSNFPGTYAAETLQDSTNGTDPSYASLAITNGIFVSTPGVRTLQVSVKRNSGTGTVTATGAISAFFMPFDGTGAIPVAP